MYSNTITYFPLYKFSWKYDRHDDRLTIYYKLPHNMRSKILSNLDENADVGYDDYLNNTVFNINDFINNDYLDIIANFKKAYTYCETSKNKYEQTIYHIIAAELEYVLVQAKALLIYEGSKHY